jgi:hypothetical protein
MFEGNVPSFQKLSASLKDCAPLISLTESLGSQDSRPCSLTIRSILSEEPGTVHRDVWQIKGLTGSRDAPSGRATAVLPSYKTLYRNIYRLREAMAKMKRLPIRNARFRRS